MSFKTFVGQVLSVGTNVIVPLLFAAAFVAFVWGVVNYFFINAGNEDRRGEGRQFIAWGILALVLLFAIWGVVNILLDVFNFGA